jgi:ribosomal protein L7/L12
MIIELGQESGLDDEAILKRLREKIGLSLEEAKACVKTYGN